MRVSLSWLSEFVKVDVSIEKLVDLLNLSGTKVEMVHSFGAGISGVVVAEVREILPHPNADNLILVEVDAGGAGQAMVVCGAHNFGPGDRVPYATVGGRVPEMEIAERKIRGVISKGMLCSGAELGVSKDHSGILVLPPDARIGDEVTRALGLDDTVLELEVTPNRPDCMGMIGVAREVGALLGHELSWPDATLSATDPGTGDVNVDIEDRDRCPRYLARFISGVAMGPSPAWMAARLMKAGIRPISNIVDCTNYVLLETGHPLHAFDAAKVHKRGIVVRTAERGETITTLDGVVRKLHPDDLLIADKRRALAIAGVMGGEDSEVSDQTTDVILECAYFDRASVAFTSRRHLLRTEASARFERGADPEAVVFAAARAAKLVAENASGRVASDAVDAYPKPVAKVGLTLRPKRTTAVLGLDVNPAAQARYLRAVGFDVAEDDGALQVESPTFRPDVTREIDLIEEVARLAGYERLPSTLPPGRTGALDSKQAAERRVRRILAGFGLREAWTPAFTEATDLESIGIQSNHPAIDQLRVANPMTADEEVLRTTLLPSLLRVAARNHAHDVDHAALFEIASAYEASGEKLPREPLLLTSVCFGPRRPRSWNAGPEEWDFFAAKGVIEGLFESLGIDSPTFSPAEGPPFHPTRAARVSLADMTLGALGEFHPDVCERFGAPQGTVGFEVSLGPVFAAIPRRSRVEELPKFPPVYMDIAVVVDESVPAEQVETTISEQGAPELEAAALFDVYRGGQVGSGKKSLAYALELRAADRTLTDAEAAAVRDRIVDALQSRFGAILRG